MLLYNIICITSLATCLWSFNYHVTPFRALTGVAIMSPFQDYIPSLLDAYLSLHDVQKRWHSSLPSSLPVLLQNTLGLIESFDRVRHTDPLLREKAFIVLAIMCTEMSDYPGLDITENGCASDVHLLCIGLITVASACLTHKSVSRLAIAQLLPCLEKQLIHDGDDDNDTAKTDIWVRVLGKYIILHSLLIAL